MAAAAPAYSNRATFFVPSIRLFDADPVPANDAKPAVVPQYRWIHCANEGIYKGHHQGEFDLTRKVFEAFKSNLRADPQFTEGTLDVDGQTYTGGIKGVIQFDYEHASEMPPWEGSIASSGAPACGWALDVDVRNGKDGKAQLWVFAELGEQIRGQISRKEYLSVSIAFTLEGVHWVTGAPIGPVLTSIAFTNHPFMRDLEPLAAANRRTGQPGAGRVKPKGNLSEAPGGSEPHTTGDQSMSDQLRERVCKALQIRTLADDEAVAAAVEETASAASSLESILGALGVSDPGAAMKVLPELTSARDKLVGCLAELDALMQQDLAVDTEASTVDVGAAMKAQGFAGDGASKALTAYRLQCISVEVKKLGDNPKFSAMREARKKGRELFLTEYGVKDADKLHLTSTLVAGPNGQQVQPPVSGKPLPASERGEVETTIDLRGLKGRNVTEKLITHLSKNEPGFDRLPWERKISRAGEIRRTSQLTLQ